MKLEAIYAEWDKDGTIDRGKLSEAALDASKLHAKYHKIYTNERILKRKKEEDLKRLRLDLSEFYTQGPNKETQERGWKLPAIGKIIKSDVDKYIDTHEEVIQLSLSIGLQHEKCSYLESVIKMLIWRHSAVKTALEVAKFEAGQ